MNETIDQQLCAAGNGDSLAESEWQNIVDQLLDQFGKFISHDFVRDAECNIDCQSGSFSRWFWSTESCEDPLEPIWCAVLAGGPAGDRSFSVTISLFLFHGQTRERIVSSRGGTYLSFSYSEEPDGHRVWKSVGWTRDEWNEWGDVEFPD